MSQSPIAPPPDESPSRPAYQPFLPPPPPYQVQEDLRLEAYKPTPLPWSKITPEDGQIIVKRLANAIVVRISWNEPSQVSVNYREAGELSGYVSTITANEIKAFQIFFEKTTGPACLGEFLDLFRKIRMPRQFGGENNHQESPETQFRDWMVRQTIHSIVSSYEARPTTQLTLSKTSHQTANLHQCIQPYHPANSYYLAAPKAAYFSGAMGGIWEGVTQGLNLIRR